MNVSWRTHSANRTARMISPSTLALAGIIGPVLFSALITVQGVLLPDYSHVRLPISALAAWPTGWIQVLNFCVFGALTTLFAHALHRAVRPTRRGVIGYGLLMLSGVGIVMSGAFSWRMIDGVPRETIPHVVAAVVVFVGTGMGLMVFSRRLRADSRWHDLATYTLASGITVLLLFLIAGAFAIDDGTPLHPWAGLLQRVMCAVWFMCMIVLAVRLRRLAAATGRSEA